MVTAGFEGWSLMRAFSGDRLRFARRSVSLSFGEAARTGLAGRSGFGRLTRIAVGGGRGRHERGCGDWLGGCLRDLVHVVGTRCELLSGLREWA
jgi:hypothetical protein